MDEKPNEINSLTEEQLQRVEGKIFLCLIDKIMFALYSEHMEMYTDYLNERFYETNASTNEMLEYCKLHDIKAFPFPMKKKTTIGYQMLFSKIKAYDCDIKDVELCEIITKFLIELMMTPMDDGDEESEPDVKASDCK